MPTITIRIPHPLKKRTADTRGPSGKELDALIDDLVDRVWGALKAAESQMSLTKDEASGHAFHGNQYVKGKSGPKPDKEELKKGLTEKTAKGKLRELFETGHAFSQEELMEVAGIDKVDTFKAFIYYMRTPKFAGKKGALDVVKDKTSGLWQVKVNTGAGYQEVPALAEAAKAIPKPKAKAKAPQAAIAAPAPPPAPPAAPPKPPADFGAVLGQLSGAHPGSMPKAEADKLYAEAMKISGDEMKERLLDLSAEAEHGDLAQDALDEGIKNTIVKWKKDKAASMAAWAQAVHGHAAKPATQGYYQADKQLAADIIEGMSPAAAVGAWKTNTANEKAGTWPAKKPIASAKKPTPNAATMSAAVPVPPKDYASLIPEGHQDVSAADFGKDARWAEEHSKLRNTLVEEGYKAADNKKSVETRLRARLKDKPNFQALVKRLGLVKEGIGSLEAKLVATWAGSSGDSNALSCAVQAAAKDAFSIPEKDLEMKNLKSLQAAKASKEGEASIYNEAFKYLNGNIDALQPQEIPTVKEALKEFVHAQYDETQEHLTSLGIKELYLARGMHVKADHDPAKGAVNLKLQPLSSFSAHFQTSRSCFASGGTTFLVKVPREQVLSTYHSGFGCTGEHEVVVIGHGKLKAFATPYAASGDNEWSAHQWVASKLKNGA